MNYGKENVRALLERGRNTPKKVAHRLTLHALKITFLVLVLTVVIAGGFAVGTVKGIIDTSPEPEALSVTPLGIASNIYDSNGQLWRRSSSPGPTGTPSPTATFPVTWSMPLSRSKTNVSGRMKGSTCAAFCVPPPLFC